ncbi:MAG: hypothetical protein B0D86_00170, partial [Candidatus Sedimenticola endophacoides]
DGLLEALCHYLQMTLLPRPGKPPVKARAFGFASARSGTIAQRVEQLFNDVAHCFGPRGTGLEARYLLQAGDGYHFLHHRESNGFSAYPAPNWQELLEILSLPNDEFRPVVIDRHTLTDTPLPEIFRQNQPGLIQIFYTAAREQSHIYVLDEQGALFYQHLQGTDEHYLVAQQQRFFNGLSYLRNLLADAPPEPGFLDGPSFYRLERDPQGRFTAARRRLGATELPAEYLELKAVSSGLDLNLTPFLLICGDTEFDSLQLGSGIYQEVARHVVSRRSRRQTYPIYLTSLELSGPAARKEWATIELLKYKRRLEGRINHALQQLNL